MVDKDGITRRMASSLFGHPRRNYEAIFGFVEAIVHEVRDDVATMIEQRGWTSSDPDTWPDAAALAKEIRAEEEGETPRT